MLKFLSGIAIIAFTTLCGYLLAKKYRRRRLFFSQWKEFNERFLSEISYYRRPIQQFIGNFSYQGEFERLLQAFLQRLQTPERVEELTEGVDFAFLKAEEKRVVEDYFLMLGKGDSASQKAYFSSIKDTLSKLQGEAEESSKRYGDLYIKMGFLCGLLLLILII